MPMRVRAWIRMTARHQTEAAAVVVANKGLPVRGAVVAVGEAVVDPAAKAGETRLAVAWPPCG
jgi:hypothetical protein